MTDFHAVEDLRKVSPVADVEEHLILEVRGHAAHTICIIVKPFAILHKVHLNVSKKQNSARDATDPTNRGGTSVKRVSTGSPDDS
jgi:hypothetical protein